MPPRLQDRRGEEKPSRGFKGSMKGGEGLPFGGARSNSGPPPDPNSAMSAKRGRQLVTLQAGGFTVKIPPFPLPETTKREATMWRWLWRTPQDAQWSKESWRLMFIGTYCRMLARLEAGDSSGTVAQNALKLAEPLGMTPKGLRLNRWCSASTRRQ